MAMDSRADSECLHRTPDAQSLGTHPFDFPETIPVKYQPSHLSPCVSDWGVEATYCGRTRVVNAVLGAIAYKSPTGVDKIPPIVR